MEGKNGKLKGKSKKRKLFPYRVHLPSRRPSARGQLFASVCGARTHKHTGARTPGQIDNWPPFCVPFGGAFDCFWFGFFFHTSRDTFFLLALPGSSGSTLFLEMFRGSLWGALWFSLNHCGALARTSGGTGPVYGMTTTTTFARTSRSNSQSCTGWLAKLVPKTRGFPGFSPARPLPVRGGDAKSRGRSGPNLGHAQLTREVFVTVVVISADLLAQWTGAGDALAIVSYCWFRDGPGVAHLERLLDTVQEGFIAAL